MKPFPLFWHPWVAQKKWQVRAIDLTIVYLLRTTATAAFFLDLFIAPRPGLDDLTALYDVM